MKELIFQKTDKILVLAPHPDDDSIGCGGLISKYAKQVDVLLLTDGCLGGNAPENIIQKTRRKEFISAMEYAGVNSYKWLDIKDRTLKDNFKTFKKIDFDNYTHVCIPNKNEFQIDHHAVFNHILNSKIKNKNIKICEYEVWTPLINPSHYINISNNHEFKEKLISFYASQLKCHNYTSHIMGLNHYRGIIHNRQYVECYTVSDLGVLEQNFLLRKKIFSIYRTSKGKKRIRILGIKVQI